MPIELPSAPPAQRIVAKDDLTLATYSWGDEDAPTVLLVHGFASSALLNFVRTGWTRDLVRAGFRVIALDQRGHGESDKPHDPAAYALERFVDDIVTVLDTYLINEVSYVGYSLGARVGWQAALDAPDRISRAVLGGIPDGTPLKRFRVDEATAFVDAGTPVDDRITAAYLTMADSLAGNDLRALIALVEGARNGPEPEGSNPPEQPILFATGSEDAILQRSRALFEATPNGTFFEIPGRHHFNAPTSRQFRDAAVEFLTIRAGL